MEWPEIVAQDALIGSDLRVYENDDVYHGPIKSARMDGDRVVIETEWTAVLEISRCEGGWKMVPGFARLTAFDSTFVQPQDLGVGRIGFELADSVGTIFPPGQNPLDPDAIQGFIVV